MPPIFGQASQAQYQGAFRTVSTGNQSGVTFGGAGQGLALIQNLQVSHQQPVQNLFEVGSNRRYYVIGKASGSFTASQILGFGPNVMSQVTSLADPCQGNRTMTVSFPNSFCTPNGGGGGSLTLTMTGVLLQSVGFSVAAQDNLINAQISGMMTDLEYVTNGLNGGGINAVGAFGGAFAG